ncbi:MAG TPA: acyl-CoA dehydrogenase [Woeseiaceae bacterium]|nr:acyl-CoA dehydrogenase [Woeseiaceae bacterium]
MSNANSLIPDSTIEFLLFDWLDTHTLFERPQFASHSRDTVEAIIELTTQVANEEFLSHYKKSDQIEPSLEDGRVKVLPEISRALSKYAELGFFAASFPEESGGMSLPEVVSAASFAQFAAANIATAAYPMLTRANARLITKFGTERQIQAFAEPQVEGRWFGTMCLSETQAGSSLADIRSRAVADGEDVYGARYRLTGNKMWISGGDQDISENIVHLVLAKIPNADSKLPSGTNGLSLFIVPKVLPDGMMNDIAIAGINHKMGYRGTANCLLNLGEREGAIGWRVGQPREGLRQMFQMMNDARIYVGLGAAALAMRGFSLSKSYASERLQGRAQGIRDGAQIAIIEHPDVKRMLLQQKVYAEGSLALCLYCAHLVDTNDSPDSDVLLGFLTPVAKTWSSEYGLLANDLAIQIHGGYGYTRDFDVEQLYRDNRLNAIHEGTTGIQAIDFLGRKILRDSGHAFEIWCARVNETCSHADASCELSDNASVLRNTINELRAVVGVLKTTESGALDNATVFLRAVGHIVISWIWLDLACAAQRVESQEFGNGIGRACRFFFESELPIAHVWLKEVVSLTDVASASVANEL